MDENTVEPQASEWEHDASDAPAADPGALKNEALADGDALMSTFAEFEQAVIGG